MGFSIPNFDVMVGTATDDGIAIETKNQGVNKALVVDQRCDVLIGC